MEYLIAGALILLVGISAFFSSSEIAFFSLPKAKVHSWRHSENSKKKLTSALLARSKDLLVLIFFLNTFVNSLVQNLSSNLVSENTGIVFSIILPFLLILFLGDYLPKYIGLVYGEKLALTSVPVFSFLKKILQKPLQLMTNFAENLSSTLFFFLKPEPPIGLEDVKEIMATSEAIGLLTGTEASLVTESIHFKSALVEDEMVPFNEISKIQEAEYTKEKALELYRANKHRIVALVRGSQEELLGIIDTTLLQSQRDIPELSKKELAFVPKTMPIDRAFLHMTHTKARFLAIYDEHGKILGILSIPLLREKFIASIASHLPKNKTAKKQTFFLATTLLEDINAQFHTDLESAHGQKTIGGWLEEQCDEIPQAGTSIVKNGLLIRVVRSSPTHVEKVFVQQHLLEALTS